MGAGTGAGRGQSSDRWAAGPAASGGGSAGADAFGRAGLCAAALGHPDLADRALHHRRRADRGLDRAVGRDGAAPARDEGAHPVAGARAGAGGADLVPFVPGVSGAGGGGPVRQPRPDAQPDDAGVLDRRLDRGAAGLGPFRQPVAADQSLDRAGAGRSAAAGFARRDRPDAVGVLAGGGVLPGLHLVPDDLALSRRPGGAGAGGAGLLGGDLCPGRGRGRRLAGAGRVPDRAVRLCRPHRAGVG
jgi:hypothetical protein